MDEPRIREPRFNQTPPFAEAQGTLQVSFLVEGDYSPTDLITTCEYRRHLTLDWQVGPAFTRTDERYQAILLLATGKYDFKLQVSLALDSSVNDFHSEDAVDVASSLTDDLQITDFSIGQRAETKIVDFAFKVNEDASLLITEVIVFYGESPQNSFSPDYDPTRQIYVGTIALLEGWNSFQVVTYHRANPAIRATDKKAIYVRPIGPTPDGPIVVGAPRNVHVITHPTTYRTKNHVEGVWDRESDVHFNCRLKTDRGEFPQFEVSRPPGKFFGLQPKTPFTFKVQKCSISGLDFGSTCSFWVEVNGVTAGPLDSVRQYFEDNSTTLSVRTLFGPWPPWLYPGTWISLRARLGE